MTPTIYLDPALVPPALRGSYAGKKFKARVCETMTIPMDAGLWSGGSRDTFQVIRLADGAALDAVQHSAAPWDASRREIEVRLVPGIAVVEHSMFRGSDMGLTFYVHPDNAAKLLPAPVELTAHEAMVLKATKSFKSSYGGKDRYQMMQDESRYAASKHTQPAFPTREQWDAAKAALVARGLLNKAGAITPAGRNAVPSTY